MKVLVLILLLYSSLSFSQVIDTDKYAIGTFFSTTWDSVGLKFGYRPADGARYVDGSAVSYKDTASYGDHINIAMKKSPILAFVSMFKPSQGPIYGGGFTLYKDHINLKFRSRSVNGGGTPEIKNIKARLEFAQVMADLTNLPARMPDGTIIMPFQKFDDMKSFKKSMKYRKAVKNPVGQMVDCVLRGMIK